MKKGTTQQISKVEQRGELTLVDLPETGEIEISKEATANSPAKRIRFPKENFKRYQMMPHQFKKTKNAIDEYEKQERKRAVFVNSIESVVGYNSLLRTLGKYFVRQVAYYRSESGGALSLEDARAAVYKQNPTEDEAIKILDDLISVPTDLISFADLMSLYDHSPSAAENLWEVIKREARNEFESGHRAAMVFEPADWMKDAWNRASYLGVRESFCAEYQPKGGIELAMIDDLAQSWVQLQYWKEKTIERSQTEVRYEDNEYTKWKAERRIERKFRHDPPGRWDIPYVKEQEAVEHAAQMQDRFQRMFFRALRQLRDWRRYVPVVIQNNGGQVNVATEGGQQQVNVKG